MIFIILEDSIIEQQDNSTDDQVTTLTQSLTILTEEKAKMESSYQQEKRHLMVSNNPLHSVYIIPHV